MNDRNKMNVGESFVDFIVTNGKTLDFSKIRKRRKKIEIVEYKQAHDNAAVMEDNILAFIDV